MQPRDLTRISPLTASPFRLAGITSSFLVSDSDQTYFTIELTIVSSTGERSTPFFASGLYSWPFTFSRVFDCPKKCGMRVVGRKSRGAEIHLAAHSSETLVAIR